VSSIIAVTVASTRHHRGRRLRVSG
jgi:hypothetical protein